MRSEERREEGGGIGCRGRRERGRRKGTDVKEEKSIMRMYNNNVIDCSNFFNTLLGGHMVRLQFFQ